ncbi:sialoadhesin-like [Clupea harengus]|uniref:Sialoadhesin-like n=1 Tax=Clupea harengus TaxID=7950 RepID=A0A8M1KCQ7_CLUHA|nr:sialoadhesin-like [Clupea harengus]
MTTLTERDAGVYYFRFKALASPHGKTTAWIHGSPGIALVVSDAELKVDPTSVTQRWINVTCATSCTLGLVDYYTWYRNGKYLKYTDEASIVIDSADGSESQGSYWCEVRAAGNRLTSSAVCVLGPECWGVTYSSEAICGLKGSSVAMSCYYKYPGGHQFKGGHWYKESPSSGEPEPLSLDPLFRGRLETTSSNCSLTIQDLRDSDSGVYLYTFKTTSSNWIKAKTGIRLSVTDLQVTVDPDTVTGYRIKTTCSTSCRGTSPLYYYWYRNGQLLRNEHGPDIDIYSSYNYYEGNYSCTIKGFENHRSTAVCILGKECWDVTYSSEAICALKGSSVDISCRYKHPAGHTNQFWFNEQQSNTEPEDLSLDHTYERRVEYKRNNSDHTLRLKDLTEEDAREYCFTL